MHVTFIARVRLTVDTDDDVQGQFWFSPANHKVVCAETKNVLLELQTGKASIYVTISPAASINKNTISNNNNKNNNNIIFFVLPRAETN